MKKNFISFLSATLPLISLIMVSSCKTSPVADGYADYVNTEIGVIDNRGSNCVIGPELPYGSINPSPFTQDGGMDGYNPKSPIRGFAQLHVSGTGWSTYGHFLISPQIKFEVGLENHDSPHSQDVNKAYYYKTHLDRYDITTEIAPSYYSTIYRFKFPASKESVLKFDASQSIMKGTISKNTVEIDSVNNQVKMQIRFEGGWPEGAYDLYLVGQYDKPATEIGVWEGNDVYKDKVSLKKDTLQDKHIGGYCKFDTSKDQQLQLKLAVSFTSFEKAAELLNSEIPNWNFERVKAEGQKAWENKLSNIQIEAQSEEQKELFYSSLYRVFTLAHDRSLDNSKWKSDAPFWDDNYAYWDTFRSAYPLLTIIDEEAVRDNLLAIIDRFKHNGCVYDGFIAGMERTGDQGGNDVDHVIVDAYLKGVKGIDWEEAYKVIKYNADHRRIGFDNPEDNTDKYMKYKELGWIPACVMSTSQTLEFAYNDYSAALMAKGLGHEEDYKKYLERSGKWINLWNPNLEDSGFKGFMDGRNEDGTFTNMPPREYGGSWKSPFYEASTWTYSYYVPHNFDKLIELMGGKEKFIERLTYGFENKLIEYTNEPAFLAFRAFTHAGRPDLSSYWVHHTLHASYDNTGYPGNDDTGAMSSWYVFCSLGIFPNAGQDYYYFNAPTVSKAVIRLSENKKLTITANAAKENVYIKSCKVNGKLWNSAFIKHSELINAKTIEFELSDKPTDWGKF